jgi:UDP-N-acetylmuramate dehydrogenase
MSRHTTWRVGGVAERVYEPADLADLVDFLRGLPKGEPVTMLGLGSNLLVRDAGLRGTVVLLYGALDNLRLEEETEQDGLLYAEAGVASARVARFASKHNLTGAEFLAGIPGTVGGALAMNAGCYGGETWRAVEKVLTVNRAGELKERKPEDYDVGYRHVELKVRGVPGLALPAEDKRPLGVRREIPDTPHPSPLTPHEQEWFAAGWFRLSKGDGDAARGRVAEMLARRSASQPLHLPNAGSVFRNPEGDHAARLIEAAGLKGLRTGGAQVSTKHANFIVNTGNATAADIEQLIQQVQAAVKEKQGVELVCEVRIVGEQK